MWSNGNRFINRFRTRDVYDLHERHARQRLAQVLITSFCESVANLNRVHSEPPLLIDDKRRILETR